MNRHIIIRILIPVFILSLLFGIPGMPAQGVKAAHPGTAFQYLQSWNFVPEAPPNNKPVITEPSPQSVTMSEDGVPTPFSLTLHATDADGDILTWSIATPALNGTASASGTGGTVLVGYTPNANYYGSDSFVVQVSDGKFKDTLTVNVTIEPVNDAPVITGQNPLSIPQNTALTITLADLLVTDVDNVYPTGFTLTVLAGADYTLDGNTVTPAADFMGTLTVPVKVNDGAVDSNTYNLSVDVAKPSRIYYVDHTAACSDSGQGTLEAPFCTIGKGAAVAAAGDTVYVLHGTYAETVVPANSGTAGKPITFKADPDVTVTGDPALTTSSSAFAVGSKSYVTIDGFNIYHTIGKGIYVENSDHITISNNHVSYAGAETTATTHQQGINLRSTTYSTVTGNVTDHNSCIGIRLINSSDYNTVSNNISFANASVIAYPVVVVSDAAGIELTGSSHNTVINNHTYGNEDSGINLYVNSTNVGSSYNLVIGNLSYGNGDHGIDNNNSPYNTIVGNTVHGNGTTGINFEGSPGSGSHHATVANNISAANGFTPPEGSFGGNLRVDSQSIAGTTLDYDLFNRESASVQIIWNDISYTSLADFRFAVSDQEIYGLEGDPLFAGPVDPILRVTGEIVPGNEITGTYKLRVGSPAIDSANSDAPSQPLTDIEGKPRVDDPDTINSGAGVRAYDDRGAHEFQLETFTLNYIAGPNGSLSGETFQTVGYGGNGTPVSAVPETGYHFVDWSDGSTDNPRTDTNVTANVEVTANFSSVQDCVNVEVVLGWNMVSVPLVADEMTLGVLFPDISQTAYAYTGSYQAVATNESLSTGVGYWMYFNAPHTYSICGEAASTRDIPVSAGWNMIGPFEDVVAVNSITSSPDGILSLTVYGYSSAYFGATELQPGSGYWVYASEAGVLHLGASQTSASALHNQVSSCSLNWQASIKVKDSSGKEELLWIGQGPSASDRLNDGCGEEQLPPTPPDGAFDARLVLPGGLDASHKDYRSSLNGQVEWLLEFQPGLSGFPFTFAWDPAALPEGTWRLQDPDGGWLVDLDMTTQAGYTLSGPDLNHLLIRYDPVKTGFQLFLPMVKP